MKMTVCLNIVRNFENCDASGVEVLENMAYLATASNLVLYLTEIMRFPLSVSANIVTNFMVTAFLLALLGGFLADAFMTTYTIYLISSKFEFLVRNILSLAIHGRNTVSLIPNFNYVGKCRGCSFS